MFNRALIFLAMAVIAQGQSATFQWINQIGGSQDQAVVGVGTIAAATLAVQSGGSRSNTLLVPIAVAAPGVFSADGSGVGQGYILNQDGTLNSPGNPAKEGSAITIRATGVGSMT